MVNPVYTVRLENLRVEAVLDSGFTGRMEFSDEVHAHAYYELVLAAEGRVWVEPDRVAPLLLEEGQICLLPPGIYHRIRPAEENSGKLAVRFQCGQEGRGQLYRPATEALNHCREAVRLAEPKRLCHILQELRQELQTRGIAQELLLQNILSQCFFLLLRQLMPEENTDAANETGEDPARLLQIEDFLLQNFHEPITEQTLAAYMHLSKRQVSRVLAQSYGKSFRTLLVELRLQQAARLLTETTLPVEQVASQVGYTSLSGFYAAFRKAYCTTAGNYRKTAKTRHNSDKGTQCAE